MEILAPKYRENPNAKVEALYAGVADGGRTVTTLVKPSVDGNRMEATRTYGPGLERGQSGRIAVLVLGGMETTLAEVQYILEESRQRRFVAQRGPGEIAAMCRLLLQRRLEEAREQRRYLRANPSEAPKGKRTLTLHLPVGYRMVQTREPGLKVLAGI